LEFGKEMDMAHEKVEEKAEIKETTSNRGVKRESDEDAEAPSPIKVQRKEGLKRQPNWGKFERVKLLSHILKYMEDPTRARDRGGRTKTDLATNVLSKVSPHLAENPAESRKLDELTTQYYRYYSISPIDVLSALKLYVLLGLVIPRTMVRECRTGSGRHSKLMATLRLIT
jgi:hypothetical protein